MRWIWFDRFVEFEPRVRAVAIKNVSLAEDHMHDHFAAYPVMTASLMIEGMAQTAGILVGEAREFKEKVILAKIKQAQFDELVIPGDTIQYEATIEQLTESAAMTSGRITVGDREIGVVDLVFSHIDNNMSGQEFPEENFVFTEQFLTLLSTFRQSGSQRVSL